MRIRLLVLLLSTTCIPAAFAQPGEGGADGFSPQHLRSELRYGGRISARQVDDAPRRNVALAAGLSAVLPGAGQAYNRQWIKAAAGVAIEATLIYAYATWRNEGLDAERAFQAYAHQHWRPDQYAAWLQDYADWLPAAETRAIDVPTGIDFQNPSAWSDVERERVRLMFSQIRALESEVYHPETGAAFSHKLPYFGEQQYYELIGKYFQFAPGWEDYPAWRDAEGRYIDEIIDPERSNPDGSKANVRGHFVSYARDHAAANDFFRRASRATMVILVNHVVAAIDAAISAKLHNTRVESGLTLMPLPNGDAVPLASVRLSF